MKNLHQAANRLVSGVHGNGLLFGLSRLIEELQDLALHSSGPRIVLGLSVLVIFL